MGECSRENVSKYVKFTFVFVFCVCGMRDLLTVP